MKKLMLKVEKLRVVLDGETIIKDLSFEVKEGDVITILGPNGAGKTVLLKTLLGIFPYQGKIKWNPKARIGYVPQRLPFIKNFPMSVEEFFGLKGISKEDTIKLLNSVGLKGMLKKCIGELSSGQFQRVLVAWALAKNPNVLLFDEPTTGIDVRGEETIYSLLARMKKKKKLTMLLVTHDLSVVYKFSNYVICLNKYPICRGPPRKILTPKMLERLYGEEVKFYTHKH